MSGTKNVDLLSRLPSELIQEIFDRFEARDRALVAPISKRFVPVQQLRLYRNVSLNSYDQLDKFCKTAKIHPGLMNNVVKLKVNIEPTPVKDDDDTDSNPFIEEEDPLVPLSNEVILLFSTLDKATSVMIIGSSRIATLILSPEVSIRYLPKLVDLDLGSTLSYFEDPFHPAFYGPLSSSASSVKALLTSFGFLSSIDLRDSSPSSQLYDLLDALDAPEHVDFLWLTRYSFHGPPSQGSILSSLTMFKSLDCLLLGGTCAPLSPEFYSSLRLLPLRTLSFEFEADVNLDELTKLISGPQKHDSLEKVSFDNVKGKMGTTFEKKDYKVYTGPGSGGFGPYPDWELPEWTDSFKPGELKRFSKVAEKEGIEVEGSALEALKVDEEFSWELDFLYSFGED
ncbi:hypothetical protein JCM5350_001301 [Sporobolomyces pararoseus]